MLGRFMVAIGAIFIGIAAWTFVQPEPPYLSYHPLPQPESYFPVSPGGEVKVWYARSNVASMGRVLQALEEPTLFYRTENEASWEIRFILLPETGEPLVARVRPTDLGYTLIVKQAMLDDDGALVGTRLVREENFSGLDVDALQDGLEELSFFDLAGPSPQMEDQNFGLINLGARTEGDLWGIEWRSGRADDDYHLVTRDSRIDLTGFEALATELFARARIAPTYADHPVVDYTVPKDFSNERTLN